VGAVDLIDRVALVYHDDLGREPEKVAVPEALVDEVHERREILVEAIAETDDVLLSQYLEGEEVSSEELRQGLRRATLAGKLVPVLCGSSLRNRGVQPVLDAIVDYLPSPLDVPPIEGLNAKGETVVRRADPREPFAALVFKIVSDPFVGRLAYMRVYSGSLPSNSSTYNSTKDKKERIGRLLQMYANHREEVDFVSAGNIAAVGGLKFTFTGDTVCDRDHPVVLESIRFPEPVIYVAIEPRTVADESKLMSALGSLSDEDPTFRYRVDENTGQTLISGMGELHLEIAVDRLMREFGVQAKVGRPQVAYRETITRTAREEGDFTLQRGPKTFSAHVVLEVAPLGRGQDYSFISKVRPERLPKEFLAAIQQAVKESFAGGVLAGYPLIDVQATLVDVAFVEGETSEGAFYSATAITFQRALQKAHPVLLEPVMKLEVVVPEEYTGDVIGDLNARRGMIEGMEPGPGGVQTIDGHVALAEMFGYATDLRSVTQGRGAFTMEFDYYDPVPPEVSRRILGEDVY
jgi:elongation factor G